MKIFGQIVRTAVNVATLPVSLAKDMLDSLTGHPTTERMADNLEKLKRESGEGGGTPE
jgi:hypothetical protein